MAVQTAVDVLARMLDAYESSEQSVHHVGATSMEDGGDALHVVLKVAVPTGPSGDGDGGATPTGAGLTDDRTLTVEYPTEAVTSFPSSPDAEVSADPTAARVSDGEVVVSMEVTITPTTDDGHPTGDAADADDTPATGGTADRSPDTDRSRDTDGAADRSPDTDGAGNGTSVTAAGDEPAADAETMRGSTAKGVDDGDVPDAIAAARHEALPAYEDREYLRAIYREYDTFSEMRAVIDMDVSTETVRRYMIDVGIHDPSSYETAGGGAGDGDRGDGASVGDGGADAAESSARVDAVPDEQLVTDGVGLPEELTVDALLEAVADASTVYGVTRRLELDQDRTREILEQLDLLELVMHRVSDDHKREVTYGDVADRLRRAAGTARTGSAT
jgi:hypothetical protein